MTVLVMYADKNYYYITADGRATGGIEIYSDNMIKVVQEDDYIYAGCGQTEDELPFREIMRESKADPWALMQLARNDTYKTMFNHFGCLVASKDYGIYHVERSPHSDDSIESDADKRPKPAVTPLEIDDLPIYDGSGKYHVQGILAGVKTLTPKKVEAAIKKAYLVNHTIGGKIRTVRLKR